MSRTAWDPSGGSCERRVSLSAAYRQFTDHSALLDAVAAAWLEQLRRTMAMPGDAADPATDSLLAVCRVYLTAAVDDPHLFRLASGPHGFGRPGGVVGAGPEGPLPAQRFLAAAAPEQAEAAWIAVHGLAVLTVDGPYSPADARRLLLPLVAAVERIDR
jgi:AcrR family transcriptional regulator